MNFQQTNSRQTTPKRRAHLPALAALALLGVAGLGAAGVAARQEAEQSGPAPATQLDQASHNFTDISRRAAPAVVFVEVEKIASGSPAMLPQGGRPEGLPDDLFKRFFDDGTLERFFGGKLPQGKSRSAPPRGPRSASGQGSGFVISAEGHILTNSHVVHGADRLRVTLADGRQFDARIVGSDTRSDVAVIQIDADDLTVLPLGNSDDLQVGEWVLAMGSPFGLPGTVTSGIVSAKGRNGVGITDYENFIQTDAAINPGNSGGPLVNLRGEVIGINTAIFSRSGGNMGIGFAIPVNMARDICEQLIADGSVTRGYLGVSIQKLTHELAAALDMKGKQGVVVAEVRPDSPAARSGFETGDVIVAFDGKPIASSGGLRNRVAATSPEIEVPVEIFRNGKRQTLEVTVGLLPAEKETAAAEPKENPTLGLTVEPLDESLAEQFGYADEQGLVVTQVAPGSAAARAGIRAGALLLQIGGQPVTGNDEFRAAVEAAEEKGSVLLLVRQEGHNRFVVLEMET